MTKQQIMSITNNYGWETKFTYRKSMDDLIILQRDKQRTVQRTIYIEPEELSALIIYLKTLKRNKVKRK